jgi:hypothetical protein
MPTATSFLAALATDLVAIALLGYAVYFRRYHRRDLLLAYLALNLGVLAVTVLLTGVQVGLGLGLGLFGILSIILLRSEQLTQEEAAYYRSHRQLVTLDAAYLDRADLLSALHRLLAAEIRHAVVLEIDLVRESPSSTSASERPILGVFSPPAPPIDRSDWHRDRAVLGFARGRQLGRHEAVGKPGRGDRASGPASARRPQVHGPRRPLQWARRSTAPAVHSAGD